MESPGFCVGNALEDADPIVFVTFHHSGYGPDGCCFVVTFEKMVHSYPAFILAKVYLTLTLFLDCKKCGLTYLTDMRVEWYKYPIKWFVFFLPPFVAVGLFLIGTIMADMAIGIFASLFCLLFGICYIVPDVIRIFKSMKRMRDPDYLKRLRQANLISIEEYEEFCMKK